jgi:hypothetical protein
LISSHKSRARLGFSQKMAGIQRILLFFADFTAFFAAGPLHFTVERF